MLQIDRFAESRARFNRSYHATPADNTLALLEVAADEAVRFHHNYIGTEHLLLAAIQTPESAAPLHALGIQLTKVRTGVEYIIGRGDRTVIAGEIGLTPRSKKVVRSAVDEAKRLHDLRIEPDHIILGIAREGEGIAAGVLESFGVSLDKLRSQVLYERQRRSGETTQGVFPASDEAFNDLADLRLLLLNPEISAGYKQNIGAVVRQLKQTYSPKPQP